MSTNVHYIALLRAILNSEADIMHDLAFFGAHIGNGASGRIALLVPAGCLNDGTQHFYLRAKIEYGIIKKNRNL